MTSMCSTLLDLASVSAAPASSASCSHTRDTAFLGSATMVNLMVMSPGRELLCWSST